MLPVVPDVTDDGAVIAGVAGAATVVTLASFDAGQPPFVTVTCRATVPDGPAVYWICDVAAPLVIVPLVTVQA